MNHNNLYLNTKRCKGGCINKLFTLHRDVKNLISLVIWWFGYISITLWFVAFYFCFVLKLPSFLLFYSFSLPSSFSYDELSDYLPTSSIQPIKLSYPFAHPIFIPHSDLAIAPTKTFSLWLTHANSVRFEYQNVS